VPRVRGGLAERAVREWLEADGLGGFASGTDNLIRTRRYHGLLQVAAKPPLGRVMLINGVAAAVRGTSGTVELATHAFAPDVLHPDGVARVVSFTVHPWPTWVLDADGVLIEHSIIVPRGHPAVVLRWRALVGAGTLTVRPLISGRDFHALHRENGTFDFTAVQRDYGWAWSPYPGVPTIEIATEGRYGHGPQWVRQYCYAAERRRGLDHIEDLAAPGTFTFELSDGPATLLCTTDAEVAATSSKVILQKESLRREAFATPLHRAADAYIVDRGAGRTIIAGYPWFGDWGRDTFIALRGLCLTTARLEDARDILLAWAEVVAEGMLPNRFADDGEAVEYNSVDASLWFCVAVGAYQVCAPPEPKLKAAVAAIVDGYRRGTRYGIGMDDDHLIACGEPGVQLTWMDAKVGDWVVTPRIGKPIEIQALWINALAVAGEHALVAKAGASLEARFIADDGHLHDVVDVDGEAGVVDSSFRPNQIFAAGGLPVVPLEPDVARQVVDLVEAKLWTPRGLRSLAPGDSSYCPRYVGGVMARDGAYHQGTVWPWLAGPFVEAWVRVRGQTVAARAEARRRFVAPLQAHLHEAGIGHVSEIADAEAPHVPRGCPFQAWSVGELLRLVEEVTA